MGSATEDPAADEDTYGNAFDDGMPYGRREGLRQRLRRKEEPTAGVETMGGGAGAIVTATWKTANGRGRYGMVICKATDNRGGGNCTSGDRGWKRRGEMWNGLADWGYSIQEST